MVEYSAELHECCFNFLDKAETETLLAVMERVSYEAGDQIFQKGDPADCLYFLVSGRVAVQNKTGFGERTQVVALLDPGAPVGEKGLLGGRQPWGYPYGGERFRASCSCPGNRLISWLAIILVLQSKLLKWLLNRVSLRLEKNSERLVHVL